PGRDRSRRPRPRWGNEHQARRHGPAQPGWLVRQRYQLHRARSPGDLDLRRFAPALRLSATADLERLFREHVPVAKAPRPRFAERSILHRRDNIAVERPGVVGVEPRGNWRMIRMAVGETDDLQTSGLGVLLDAELFQGIERVAVPGPVGDGVAHATEFGDLVVGASDPANQCPAGFTWIARFEMFPHLVHHGPLDS